MTTQNHDPRANLRPRDILTHLALENASQQVIAVRSASNVGSQLLAPAPEARVRPTLGGFTRIGKRGGALADIESGEPFIVSALAQSCVVPPLMKVLPGSGLRRGGGLTVAAGSQVQYLENTGMYFAGQGFVRPLSNPVKKDGYLVVLYGNVAPEVAVAQATGKEGSTFSGQARGFEGEDRVTQAILDGTVRAGDVVVIRHEGPRRSGHARDAKSDQRDHEAWLGRYSGIRHRRYSGSRPASLVGRASPEASLGDPIGLLRHGDEITINTEAGINVTLSAQEPRRRRAAWKQRRIRACPRRLAVEACQVTGAAGGAVIRLAPRSVKYSSA